MNKEEEKKREKVEIALVEVMMRKAKEIGEHVFLGFWGKWVISRI